MILQEINNELEVYKSTVHKIVSELYASNYAERNDERKKYRLDLKFVDIFSNVISKIGKVELLNCTEVGKVILSFKPSAICKLILDTITYVRRRRYELYCYCLRLT